MAIGSQHPVHLAQNGVRSIAVIECVRQQNGIHGIVLHGQPVQVRNRRGFAVGRLGDQRTMLRARKATEGAIIAPQTELQAVFAEYPVQSLLDHAGLLL